MSLSLQQQYDVAVSAIETGDMDLLSRMLVDPSAIGIDEQRSVAEKLGIKRGLLSAFVNTVSDPTVWLASLFSRRFPTNAWINGVIPNRFVGAANEFTGVSLFTRPVENFFRGTTVPRLVALKARREAEVMKVGSKIFDVMARPNWKQEMPTVSLLLEGQNPAGATPELREVANRIRSHMDEMWGFLSQTKRVTGGLEGEQVTRAVAGEFAPNRAPVYLRDYLPHIPNLHLGSNESVIHVDGREALARMGRSKSAQALNLKDIRLNEIWGVNESDRLGSNFTRYQTMINHVGSQVFNPALFRRQRHGLTLHGAAGGDLFYTDLNLVLQKYVHGVARTYANNAPLSLGERRLASFLNEAGERVMPTSDPIIVQLINEGLTTMGAKSVRQVIPGTQVVRDVINPSSLNPPSFRALQSLVRNVQGTQGEDEILWGNLFSSIRSKLAGAHARMSKKQVAQVDDALHTFERNQSYRNISNGVASFFYSTTLGLNPWAAMQNMLQPALTTMPAIGIGPTLTGFRTMGERLPKYASAVRKHLGDLKGTTRGNPLLRLNEATERAFGEVFPELRQQGIKLDPRLLEIDEQALISAGKGPVGIFGTSKFRNVDQFYKFLLQPFTHAELSNQIVSFYGARDAMKKAIRRGEYQVPIGQNLDDVLNFEAGQVVNATQFRPGPGSRTVIQNLLPAPLRMFTTFPIRSLSFFTESTVRGALSAKQVENADIFTRLTNGRNLGTVARSYILGKALVNGFRDTLGVDVGGALGLAVPFQGIAPPGQNFVSVPVPPVAGTAFALAQATAERDLDKIQPLVLPGIGEIPVIPKTLFPGGVGLTKVGRALQTFRPDLGGFVDDEERLMYQAGSYDLALAMLGVPLDKQRRSRQVMERLYDLRTRQRELKRQFTVSYINGDFPGMTATQQQWSRAFPDMPPLSITEDEANRYRAQQRLTQAQRMLQSLGSQSRFLEADIYEYDPDLIAPSYGIGAP